MSNFGNYIKTLGDQVDKAIENEVYNFLPQGSKIDYLDCGCDDGIKTVKRAGIIGTKRVLGLESESSRARKALQNGIKVKLIDLNKKWPLKGQSVDCITATEVVEHLIDEDNFFSECHRVLKKKGRLIISTDNLAGYHNIFALLLGNQPYTGPYLSKVFPIGHRPHAKFYQHNMNKTMSPHLNVMTSKALEQLFRFYKFKIIAVRGIGFYPLPAPVSTLFSSIDKRHAAHSFIVGEK